MGKKKTDRQKPALKKETVRKLDQAALTPDALRQVVGGGYKASYPCGTSM